MNGKIPITHCRPTHGTARNRKQLDIKRQLTHLSRTEFPTDINWDSPFVFKGFLVAFLIDLKIEQDSELFASINARRVSYIVCRAASIYVK